jgi:hypothetical protein
VDVDRSAATAALVLLLGATAAGCSQGPAVHHVRLAYDANRSLAMTIGQTVDFDVVPVAGERPEARLCGTTARTNVLQPVGAVSALRFKAVHVGRETLCGVPAQAVARCKRVKCAEGALDDQRTMVDIRVG